MKKLLPLLLLLTVSLLAFSACGVGKNNIEDYEWEMRTIASVENEQYNTIAIGEADPAYPEAQIIEMTLTAKDGKITITDITNNKTYEGTYELESKNSESTIYNISIDGKDGYASVAMTKYSDGSEEPTLPINLEDYSIYFYAK